VAELILKEKYHTIVYSVRGGNCNCSQTPFNSEVDAIQ
jgi:hypothetical protein